MTSNTGNSAIQLLGFGLLLALIKLISSFIDPYNILDFVIFLFAGIILGGRVPQKSRALGLLLALPAFILCLFFVLRLGYTSIANGIGTSYAFSLIVIPLATSIGLHNNAKRTLSKSEMKK